MGVGGHCVIEVHTDALYDWGRSAARDRLVLVQWWVIEIGEVIGC